MADRDEVVAWLRANEWRYSRAAKHFGLDRDIVREWGREVRAGKAFPLPASPAPGARAREGAELDPAKMSKLARLEWQLQVVLTDLDEVRSAGKATAIAMLHKQAQQLGKELDGARDAARRAGELADQDIDPAELMAKLLELVRDAPDPVIDALAEAIEQRRNPIRLVT